MSDLGKLIMVFSLLTAYMMYSQLAVIWYENLPAETRFVLPRLTSSPWQWISAGLLAVIYLGPLVLLLTRKSRRSPAWLGTVAAAVLAGMWVERWWLVTPTLGGALQFGWAELSITAAFLAAMVLGMTLCGRRFAEVNPAAGSGHAQS